MYVCMYVCMYAFMYVCMYVRTYVCIIFGQHLKSGRYRAALRVTAVTFGASLNWKFMVTDEGVEPCARLANHC